MGDAHRNQKHPRHLLPVILAAIVAVSGCVAVPAATPPTRAVEAPAAVMRPAVLDIEPAQPPALTALVDTGPEPARAPQKAAAHAEQHHPEHDNQSHHGRRQADTPPPARPAPQHSAPRRRHPDPVPTPQRPRQHRSTSPAPPSPATTYDMRQICRAAARNAVDEQIVTLCRTTWGS